MIPDLLYSGTVIPAHPLALDPDRKLDERRQRRLTRYYIASGVGGVAVGVHTTQFAIRDPKVGLYETVLRLAAEEIEAAQLERPFIKVAGLCGPTAQAVEEAKTALKYGYHIGLLSLGGLNHLSEGELIAHVRTVSEIIPIFGFYLQPSVGGRILSYHFWEQLVEIPGVKAIKTAPFNRYQTLDVVRAVCHSSRCNDIALYTGNDDNIVADLLTSYRFMVDGREVIKRFAGGLLGHWSVWTGKVVPLFDRIKKCILEDYSGAGKLLEEGIAVTDMNAALFDPSHAFHGSIAGIHEVLRRQGLLEGIWCLDEAETLSPGQLEEIDRVIAAYPQLTDDDFISAFLEKEKNIVNA
ncbi:dihydrodipicolinate synthase family protein [Chitinophaga qingshengii]|uniref:Dihydrodipicolinate synthase family protein n=1 Tax=Chitinophaga qingshengii TaxID=1569794 RepID=A0ABR7TGG1_9BACT|nr:dihydrodipicolinate synthase family protein [Chitinophaga qingshengii]MBC9929494.1 dihydrodipicolinate synthase family protein [Chitinophaga qingshengii]